MDEIKQCEICGAMLIGNIDKMYHNCSRLTRLDETEESDGYAFDTMLSDDNVLYGQRLAFGFASLHGDSRDDD